MAEQPEKRPGRPRKIEALAQDKRQPKISFAKAKANAKAKQPTKVGNVTITGYGTRALAASNSLAYVFAQLSFAQRDSVEGDGDEPKLDAQLVCQKGPDSART